MLAGGELTDALALAPAAGTVIDEADAAPEQALFHLINRSAEAGEFGCRAEGHRHAFGADREARPREQDHRDGGP